jgi:hypothetical protein
MVMYGNVSSRQIKLLMGSRRVSSWVKLFFYQKISLKAIAQTYIFTALEYIAK